MSNFDKISLEIIADDETSYSENIIARFMQHADKHSLNFVSATNFESQMVAPPLFVEIMAKFEMEMQHIFFLAQLESAGWWTAWFKSADDKTAALLTFHSADDPKGKQPTFMRNIRLNVMSDSYEELVRINDAAKELFKSNLVVKRTELKPKTTTAIRYWFNGGSGPSFRDREIDTPGWQAIAQNYPEAFRPQLAEVMEFKADPSGAAEIAGRLILWHGKPGTGKTTAIQALALEWFEFCDVHYISDAESFFGMAGYMMGVILPERSDGAIQSNRVERLKRFEEMMDGEAEMAAYGDTPEDKRPWQLFVIEDADELLRADAKDRTGQGLSRLLNLTDGILGKGLRILFLITTNEELAHVHPAVQRDGRCLSSVEFTLFPYEEAVAWMKDHNTSGEEILLEEKSYSLAELYSTLQTRRKAIRFKEARKGSMGFARTR